MPNLGRTKGYEMDKKARNIAQTKICGNTDVKIDDSFV